MRLAVACAALVSGMGAATAQDLRPGSEAAVVERVRFASFDVDRDGAPVMLDAILYVPRRTASWPVPAVVAFHGCAGMYSPLHSRRNELSVRLQTMAGLLVREGYAVLFPDSFRPRGRESICNVPVADRSFTQIQRRLDAFAALAYLQRRPEIAPDRIAALGWSHGGSTVLVTNNAASPAVRNYRAQTSGPYFRAAVAFYPGCFESLRASEGYVSAAPLLMLVAGSDDWTSPQACIRLAQRLQGSPVSTRIVVYPETYHGFDGPNRQKPVHLDVPNGVHPGKGVTVAVNPAAREDAYVQVEAFLHAALAAGAQ